MGRRQARTAQSAARARPLRGALHTGVQRAVGRLRDALAADLPALLELEAGFPGDRLSRRQFRHHLASPTARLRVLDDGGIRGYALLLRHARMASWRLYSLVVDPRCRGTGLGARLLADAERLAGEAGAAALTLEVREDNAAAIALYRRHGWQDAGRIAAYYDDGCAALRLRRELPGAAGRSRMAD